PWIFAVPVGIAPKAGAEQLRRLVRAHGNLACQGQAESRWLVAVVSILPLGVEADDLSLHVIEGQSHRPERRCGDAYAVIDAVGEIHGPLQGLHAANRTTDDELNAIDSEVIENLSLRSDNIADRDQGEVRAIGPPGAGIDGLWTGRAVTRSQNVDADYAIGGDAEEVIGGKQLGPPIGNFGGAGERVTDEDHVVARRVEFTVHGVLKSHGAEFASAFQGEALLFCKRVLCPDRRNDGHHSLLLLLCCPYFAVAAFGDSPVAFSNPWVRSATMSRRSSIPTDKRTNSGVTPVSLCSASESC